MRFLFVGAAMLLLSLLSSQSATALVKAMSIDEVASSSDFVATGTVRTARPIWENGEIVTYYTVIIDASPLRNAAEVSEETLLVRSRGGELDGLGMRVSTEPLLAVGDRRLFLLKRYEEVPVGFILDNLPLFEFHEGYYGALSIDGDAIGMPDGSNASLDSLSQNLSK